MVATVELLDEFGQETSLTYANQFIAIKLVTSGAWSINGIKVATLPWLDETP